ncbi:MAG: ribonuclease HI [Gemmatimonadetes bacterium]|jgi:ribonuclease HI|nr:ribonuclease HI [Gemmatimonadota bacterium]
MTGELVAIYADESCLGNGKDGDNPGAAGVLIEYERPGGGLVRRDLWVSERATTNNRMALISVTEALGAIGAKGGRFRVVFTTDSRYIVDGMTSWVHGWARNGWKRKTGAIENLELWHDALEACEGHAIAWRWVRGHNGHAQNEYANYLATRAAAEQTASGGLVESEFDAWMAEQVAKRKKVGAPDGFPDGARFTPHASLPRIS